MKDRAGWQAKICHQILGDFRRFCSKIIGEFLLGVLSVKQKALHPVTMQQKTVYSIELYI